LAATEGEDVTFYDFLGITPNANQDDINKAYKKKSRVLHPDKVKQQFIADKSSGRGANKGQNKKKPGVHVSKGPTKAEIKAAAKAASDRFARLGLVTNILRGSGRERYDHFLKNGFPKWKGTGYYYARFRPGLGTVLTGLFIFVGGGGHYIALYMSWKRQQEFVGRYIKFARHQAWGDNLGIPGLDGTATPPAADSDADPAQQPMNRRQRRMQEKDAKKDKSEKKAKVVKASPVGTPPSGATGRKKRVVAENGKILVVDAAGNVYLEQQDENGETHEFLLDVSILDPFSDHLLSPFSPMNYLSLQSETLRCSALQYGYSTKLPVDRRNLLLQSPQMSLIPLMRSKRVMMIPRITKSSRRLKQQHKMVMREL
jgi:curved DNA-binding protein CbpA